MFAKTLFVFNRCNNRCLNCCFITQSKSPNYYSKTLLKNKLLAFKEEDKDPITISLTGGEPTLNEDLFDILKEARILFPETEIVLLTNGRKFFYKDYVRKFFALNMSNIKVAIPLYAHNPHLHDSLTQVEDSFKQTIQGIESLLDKNCCVELRVIINQVNYRHLRDIAEYIFKKFPSVAYLVFIAMEINRDILKTGIVAKYSEFMPYLQETLKETAGEKEKIKLYHFPLCIVEHKYWDFIFKSIEDYKLTFPHQCNLCVYRNKCMGVLKSYMGCCGNAEFKPIKNQYA